VHPAIVLLDALSADLLERLRYQLERVLLSSNQTIHEPGEVAEHVFFPTSGLISLVATTTEGQSVEIGMIGREGMFSVAAILGDDTPSQRAMVQLPGSALRMPARLLCEEAEANHSLRVLLLRYTQATLVASAQSAACNRLHLIEQRAARWLLSAHDRAEGDELRRGLLTLCEQAKDAANGLDFMRGSGDQDNSLRSNRLIHAALKNLLRSIRPDQHSAIPIWHPAAHVKS
jgi:CRP-like cAMP-binding protein